MTSADSLNQRGAELYLKGDLEGAKSLYLASLKLSPGYVHSMANLVDILSQQNHLTAALTLSRKLISLSPQDGNFWSMAGNLLMRLGRYAESESALSKAAELCPDNRAVWHSLGLLYYRMDRYQEAAQSLRTIISMGGDGPIIRNDLAHIQMAEGDLGEGLKNYEARWWNLPHLQPWDFHIPEWQGEELGGKSILVHGEQGYGDTIMCSRFIVDLKRLHPARVTFGVPQSMVSLFQAQDWNINVLAIEDMNDDLVMKGFDYQSPLYSMMRHLGILKCSIRPEPYLVPPLITGPKPHPKMTNVGICWASGKRSRKFDWRRRVSPLELWLPLAEVPGVQLWSLYINSGEEIKQLGAESLVLDGLSPEGDWASAAAFLHQLDLIITVDTAVAHLAAALGKSTWMLSQFYHCWRWWDLDGGTGRPWYDSMRVLKQDKLEGWKEQLDLCREMLPALSQREERVA